MQMSSVFSAVDAYFASVSAKFVLAFEKVPKVGAEKDDQAY